jgi:hypothetical protein
MRFNNKKKQLTDKLEKEGELKHRDYWIIAWKVKIMEGVVL